MRALYNYHCPVFITIHDKDPEQRSEQWQLQQMQGNILVLGMCNKSLFYEIDYANIEVILP